MGYAGLAVAVAGLIVMPGGSTPWVLAVGAVLWLAAAVTLAGFSWSRKELPSYDLDSGRSGFCSSTTRSTSGRRPGGPDGFCTRAAVRGASPSPC